ncbi:UPF0104 family protein [Methanobacterium alkalithermotolerans]|uniref:UPF0104 family protein n=2 Tax=Methanobacterium alkalithermotolerans TaxID=2731220 RepID=A0A8T8K456_9EURY|nr:UPF0104 family protein [Methanobacterium alkalithermotolerans]
MRYKTLVLLLMGIGTLIGMILFIGPGNIESAIKMANSSYIAFAVLIQFVIYGLWTWRWSININAVHIPIKKIHVFPMVMVGMAVNNITPSARGGGEPVRGYILSKYSGSSFEKSFATVIADRGLDTFPFIVLAIITIVGAVFYLNLPDYAIYALILAVIVLSTLFLIVIYMSFNLEFGHKVSLWIVGLIKKFSKKDHSQLEEKAVNSINNFQASMRIMIKNRNVILYSIPISFLIWILEIFRVYLIFSAFNVEISFLIIAQVFIISTLIGLIPLLPGGLGAIDGVMILLFSAAGVPPSISAAATLVERFVSLWMTSIIGIAMIPYFGTTLIKRITKKV